MSSMEPWEPTAMHLSPVQQTSTCQSLRLVEKVERMLGVGGLLRVVTFLRGRPPLSALTRAVIKQIRQARGRRPSQYLSLGKPRKWMVRPGTRIRRPMCVDGERCGAFWAGLANSALETWSRRVALGSHFSLKLPGY